MTRLQTVRTRSGAVIETSNNSYAFHHLRGDVIKGGNKADIEGKVTYVGDNLAKNYITSHDFSEVPTEVIEAVSEMGLEVVDGVDGGWDSWDGRPEFSETYIDVSEMETVE